MSTKGQTLTEKWQAMSLESRAMTWQRVEQARERANDKEACQECGAQAAFCSCADELARLTMPELFTRYIELAGSMPRATMGKIREGWARRGETGTDAMGLVDWRP